MKNQTIKKLSVIFPGLLTIAFLAFGFVPAAAHDGDDHGNCETKECRATLVEAKKATAKYHDFQRAIDDGFIQMGPCVAVPALGAMGFHYGKPSRIMNPNVDAAEPEVLLYIPEEDGTMRLVGLEYVVPYALSPTAPELFGRAYDFDAMRNQWALHVWAWRSNPSGIFAPFNPKLECPAPVN